LIRITPGFTTDIKIRYLIHNFPELVMISHSNIHQETLMITFFMNKIKERVNELSKLHTLFKSIKPRLLIHWSTKDQLDCMWLMRINQL